MITGAKAGLGKAYVRGFNEGLKSNEYKAFIMMDADFSHDPHAIPGLLAEIDNGAEYVIGSRYVHGGSIPGNWPLMRIINSRVANFMARNLTDISGDVTDMTGGFKAISTAALRRVNLKQMNAAGYVFQVSLLHEFASMNATIRELPIKFIDRQYGISKMKLRDILEFIYRAYKLNPTSRIATLLRFGTVGLCGSIVNIVILSLFVHLTDISVLIGVLIAIEVSIITNFFMNHYYTFRLREGQNDIHTKNASIVVKLIKFNTGALGGAVISFSTFTVLHKWLLLNYLISDILAIIFAVGWNYWMSTKVVWKIVDARD